MCEYCEGNDTQWLLCVNYHEINSCWGGKPSKMKIDGNTICSVIEAETTLCHHGEKQVVNSRWFNINFCPMCGRALKEQFQRIAMDELEKELENHVAIRLLNMVSKVTTAYDSGKPFFDYSKPLEDQWIEKELFEVIKLYFDQREEIVRCRDCAYYRDIQWVITTDIPDVCTFFSDGVKVEPDGFCKWGKRGSE